MEKENKKTKTIVAGTKSNNTYIYSALFGDMEKAKNFLQNKISACDILLSNTNEQYKEKHKKVLALIEQEKPIAIYIENNIVRVYLTRDFVLHCQADYLQSAKDLFGIENAVVIGAGLQDVAESQADLQAIQKAFADYQAEQEKAESKKAK